MSSADFLLVRPLKLDGTVPFSRASEATYFDAAGVLQTAPPNTLRVTYDPSDLSKAPFAVVDLEPATNYIRNNTMQGAGPGVMPNLWGPSDRTSLGISCDPVGVGVESGIEFLDLRYSGTATSGATLFLRFEQSGPVPAQADQKWVASVLLKAVIGDPSTIQMFVTERDVAAGSTGIRYYGLSSISSKLDAHSAEYDTVGQTTSSIYFGLAVYFNAGQAYDFTIRVALPHLCRDKLPRFPIKTSNGAVTRAADVIGPGAGLLYSSVPITEPLWAAGTYAKGAKVRDASNFVFESIADGNTAGVTDKTKWLPLGVTNRLKMFDKAVNSQTTAPDSLTVVVKAGQLANTLTLLNAAGASVTVTQSESGYSRTISLVSHNVLSWYDFYYQEPQWTGDVTFGNIPPYINALLTVHVKSPGNQAALGGFFFGRAKFIGTTQWGLKAGILSYSGDEEDDFGNVTLLPRDSAKRMNFEVSIPRGYEDEAFRFLRAADNVEMVAIASTEWSMTQSYGYLGQWEVPLGIEGETMPVEWRGLI